MASNCVILQSGFLCLKGPKIIKGTDADSGIKEVESFVMNRPVVIDNVGFYYHSEIDKLFKEYIATSTKIGLKQEFKDQFVIAAYDAFGFDYIDEWISLQNNNQYIGDLHSRFIKDMLTFIATGKRSIMADNWAMLIDRSSGNTDKNFYSKIDPKDYFNYKNSSWAGDKIDNNTVIDFFHSWTNQPNGLHDFFMTVGLIFGKHEGRHIVT